MMHSVHYGLHTLDSVVLYNTSAATTEDGTWTLQYSEDHSLAVSVVQRNHYTNSVRIGDLAGLVSSQHYRL
jgi:hypothetical protein